MSRSTRPFLARGGPSGERCEGCRLRPSHCLCGVVTAQHTGAAMCLLMHDAEPMKPSNTGWLIADVVAETYAFGWARTQTDPALLALLQDPQWQPYVVFPGEFVQPPERVVQRLVAPAAPVGEGEHDGAAPRPLFVLLDATWSEASKMFRKSPYLNSFPVLSLHPEQMSGYRLRRSRREDHFCTSEVAALCLELTGQRADRRAGQTLEAYLDVYTHHYLQAKHQLPPQREGAEHLRLRSVLNAA